MGPEEASVPSLDGSCRLASLGPTPGRGKSEAKKNGQRTPFPAVRMSDGDLNILETWSRVGRIYFPEESGILTSLTPVLFFQNLSPDS